MKITLALLLLMILSGAVAVAQSTSPTTENPTPEQLAAFDRFMNRVSPLQVTIKQTRVYLEMYEHDLGKWPESWTSVESKYGTSIWESREVRESFTKSFVLLRGVPGHINTREEGEYEATMMMVMTSPIERKLSQDKQELGRWAIWKTFRGQIVTRWHPEQEITSFSAWPEVQSAIGEHIKSVVWSDAPTSSPQQTHATLTQPPVSKKAAEAKPTTPASSKKPTSSAPWSFIVVLILAATGRKRHAQRPMKSLAS